jgi:rhodanese-related sulfurtransferase
MRYAYLLFALLLLCVLAACGGTTSTTATLDVPAEIDPTDRPQVMDVVTVASIKDDPDVVLIDVREPEEYAAGHIPGVLLIPMGEVPQRLDEIPTDKTVITYCRSGNRSGQVMQFLQQQGYDNVHNMEGGIIAWEQAGRPVK